MLAFALFYGPFTFAKPGDPVEDRATLDRELQDLRRLRGLQGEVGNLQGQIDKERRLQAIDRKKTTKFEEMRKAFDEQVTTTWKNLPPRPTIALSNKRKSEKPEEATIPFKSANLDELITEWGGLIDGFTRVEAIDKGLQTGRTSGGANFVVQLDPRTPEEAQRAQQNRDAGKDPMADLTIPLADVEKAKTKIKESLTPIFTVDSSTTLAGLIMATPSPTPAVNPNPTNELQVAGETHPDNPTTNKPPTIDEGGPKNGEFGPAVKDVNDFLKGKLKDAKQALDDLNNERDQANKPQNQNPMANNDGGGNPNGQDKKKQDDNKNKGQGGGGGGGGGDQGGGGGGGSGNYGSMGQSPSVTGAALGIAGINPDGAFSPFFPSTGGRGLANAPFENPKPIPVSLKNPHPSATQSGSVSKEMPKMGGIKVGDSKPGQGGSGERGATEGAPAAAAERGGAGLGSAAAAAALGDIPNQGGGETGSNGIPNSEVAVAYGQSGDASSVAAPEGNKTNELALGLATPQNREIVSPSRKAGEPGGPEIFKIPSKIVKDKKLLTNL